MNLAQPSPVHIDPSSEAQDFFGSSNFLVVKLTDYCNLACTYCHQDALTGKAVLMPMETFKNAVRLVLGSSEAPVVYVQFHGGEPLLMPDEFFREAVAWCKETLERPDRRVEFFMQTNLTRVFKEKEAMLKELNIKVSFSLDGPPQINDEMRGGGRRIMDNWRRMRANGTDAGTICLIQPSNWDRMEEVIQFFDEEGIHSARFNLMVPDGRGKDCEGTNAEKLFQAKRKVLDHMLQTQGQRVIDTSLVTAMKKFVKANGAPKTYEYHGCESLYCQAGRSLFSLNPDGKFYSCDRIAESPSWAMGNVNQAFGEREKTYATKKRQDFHTKDDWWARCEGCDAKKICEFSCSAYYVDKVDTREVECQYTKKMYKYIVEKKTEVLNFMKGGLKPIYVDEKAPLQKQDEETWVIRDLAADAAYNSVSLHDTLALNKHYQLFQRGEQYYLYLFKRDKIFEVDEMVAEIAQFNGCVPPHFIEKALGDRHSAKKLKEIIDNIERLVPEIFMGAKAPLGASVNPGERAVVMA